jgi:hypothetical protein
MVVEIGVPPMGVVSIRADHHPIGKGGDGFETVWAGLDQAAGEEQGGGSENQQAASQGFSIQPAGQDSVPGVDLANPRVGRRAGRSNGSRLGFNLDSSKVRT